MELSGVLCNWDSEKNYGFITTDADVPDVFVHITAFSNRHVKPAVGMRVFFNLDEDSQGRPRATDARIAGRVHLTPQARVLVVAAMFLGVVALLGMAGFVPKLILLLYLATSVVSFVLYAVDKVAAESGRRRTPEATLHVVALAGGWPGALVAQQLLRHKTRKVTFRRLYWVTVVMNILALVAVMAAYTSV